MKRRWDDCCTRLRNAWAMQPLTFVLLALLTALASAAGYTQPWLLDHGELLVYDINTAALARRPPPKIALVIIGEKSLTKLGAWPFPRTHHATLLQRLRLARVVGFDILFPEDSTDASEDQEFAAAITLHGKVVLAAHTKTEFEKMGQDRQNVVLPTAPLFEAAADVGYTNFDAELDGIIRYARPVRTAGEEALPSLAFSLARQTLKDEGEMARQGEGFILKLGGQNLPLDSRARLWFVPSPQAPPTFEYSDVLEGLVSAQAFQDTIVLVGAGASGAADFQIIPRAFGNEVISGVRFNAEELRSLLTGEVIRKGPDWANALTAAVLALAGGLITLWLRPLRGGIAILSVCFFWLIFTRYLLTQHWFWVGAFIPIAMTITMGALMLLARMTSLHERWRVQYVSLDNIVSLDADEAKNFDTIGAYLQALWTRVETKTDIRFLGGPFTQEQLPSEFSSAVASTDGVFIIAGPGARRKMAVPLRSGNELTYALLGWTKRVSADSARSAAALTISAGWFFHVQAESQKRRMVLIDTIKAIFTALDYRDPITGGHSTRVSELTLRIMDKMNLPQQLYEDIHLGALVHDIGKIGIPDHILNKKDSLTSEEYQVIRNHPDIAQGILASVKLPQAAFDAVYHHHERFDGSGYPQGLQGEEISLAGRIVAIADVFDAISHNRPYRQGQALDVVLGILSQMGGNHFDPAILSIFLELFETDVTSNPEPDPTSTNVSERAPHDGCSPSRHSWPPFKPCQSPQQQITVATEEELSA